MKSSDLMGILVDYAEESVANYFCEKDDFCRKNKGQQGFTICSKVILGSSDNNDIVADIFRFITASFSLYSAMLRESLAIRKRWCKRFVTSHSSSSITSLRILGDTHTSSFFSLLAFTLP